MDAAIYGITIGASLKAAPLYRLGALRSQESQIDTKTTILRFEKGYVLEFEGQIAGILGFGMTVGDYPLIKYHNTKDEIIAALGRPLLQSVTKLFYSSTQLQHREMEVEWLHYEKCIRVGCVTKFAELLTDLDQSRFLIGGLGNEFSF